jgi:aspartate/methionine/tyrosine aminotransferase
MKGLVNYRNQIPQSGIREIFEKSFGIPNVIHLEMGEPNFDTPSFIKDAAIEAIKEGYTHYTPSSGILSLRNEISNHLCKYNINAKAEEITVTPGAVTAITLSLLSLIDSGEEVLIPNPGWIYSNMILSQSSIPISYPLRMENNFLPDFSELDQLVTEKTKVIIVNSPGNPTGAVFTEAKIKELLEFASRHNLYVISDEVYDGMIFEGSHLSPKSYDTENRVISIFSFSKNYAMTGWRIGYSVAPLEVSKLISKLQEPMVACPNSISQIAAEAALKGSQQVVVEMKDIYKNRRDKVMGILESEGILAFNPKGAFYMMIDISQSGKSSKEFALELLESKLVAVAPGSAFGSNSDHMVRISLATQESELIEGVSRICSLLKRLC